MVVLKYRCPVFPFNYRYLIFLGYAWNFCSDIPKSLLPKPCVKKGKTGAALQFSNDSSKEDLCNVIGEYDRNEDTDKMYSLLDPNDPSKGISITYKSSHICASSTNKNRTAVLEITCDNVQGVVISAGETGLKPCESNLRMKSYYGCPLECPISTNGLCDSHGHCAYDTNLKQAYCFCNIGYSGSSCSSRQSSNNDSTYNGYSAQLGLIITLLLLALGLMGAIIVLSLKVGEFRQQQFLVSSGADSYKPLAGGESELIKVQTIQFRKEIPEYQY